MNEVRQTLSIIMPCQNEEQTVGICIDDAIRMMAGNGISGQVIVVDNGSSDASAAVAARHGATVISEDRPGYGLAIRAGLAAATGDIIIIGDCDTTYDFVEAYTIYEMLSGGEYDMVIPYRSRDKMQKGAMSLSHIIGAGFLSYIARLRFGSDVRDFHCGLRGLTKAALGKIKLHTQGMEFASEMIAEAKRCDLRIGQFPITLRKCTYPRSSKLRTVRDGMRHLLYIIKTH